MNSPFNGSFTCGLTQDLRVVATGKSGAMVWEFQVDKFLKKKIVFRMHPFSLFHLEFPTISYYDSISSMKFDVRGSTCFI